MSLELKPSSRGGLIGCGAVARHHLAAWSRCSEVKIEALCEVSPQRLDEAGALMPGARLYTDSAAMFRAGALDFVEICTGPEPHRELVEMAAAARVHVLCQKPVALQRDDLRAMIQACRAAGVRFMVHENWRFRAWYRVMRQAIDAGLVGRPCRLRLAHRDTRALRPGGFGAQGFLAHRDQLILMEMGCHLVDVARYLMGEIVAVQAMTARFGDGHPGEDVAMLHLRFATGALGCLDMSWCAPADLDRPEWALNQTVVEGDRATLRLLRDGQVELVDLDGAATRRPVALPPADQVYLEGYLATQRHFLDGLRTGLPHETSGEETLKTMDVIWAAYRSAAEGRLLEVPQPES